LLRTVIDNIPDSIYCKDTAGRKTLVNLTELQYSRTTSETEIIGKTDFDLYPKELAEAFFADDQTVLQTGQPVLNREEYVLDNNGMKKWLLTSKLPMKDEAGNITGLVGIGRDITIRRQTEEELKLKNEELSSLNAEKDKFFSIIAHDLKGPFNGFLGLTQVMAEELPSLTMDEVQKIAVQMSKSATNLYSLLTNLLEWSQIKKGVFPFNPEVIQLAAVVSSSIDMLHDSAKRKNIEIATDIADGLLAFADMNMFQTIIRNLVLNAIKFTHKGGKVSILAKTTSDNFIEISVQDNGIGMSQPIIENLFRIDVQTNRTGTEGEPSTGLGLLLSKEFVEKHGCKIRVESEEANLPAGKAGGSTFYFSLPIFTAPESESNNSIEILNPEKKVQNNNLKILIAEDDETSGELISIHVRKFGKEIINVQNGREAVEACRNNTDIDLILMDIQMPELSGYEATHQIRQFNTEVIVIALTAFALTGDREKAIEAGCNDYIAKPINKSELMGLIQKYFKK
jgi:PAS domain S-box-containing protein